MSRLQLFGRSVLALVGAAAVCADVSAAQAPPPGGPPPGAFPGAPPAAAGPALPRRYEEAPAFPAFPAPRPPANPKAGAIIDLTGNWVSIVTEDYLQRMFTPWAGEYEGLSLTPAAKAVADKWTAAQDGSCKAYGVGGLMRLPTRLRIGWDGVDVLKIETDAGVQTRRIVFKPPAATGPRTLQGDSLGAWQPLVPQLPFNPLLMATVTGGSGPPKPTGTLKVTTTNHVGGWLRKNGVPYSEDASIVEYFDRWPGPDGSEWMSVTTMVTDPANLNEPYYTSSHFRKEPDDSKWRPKPCKP